MIPRHKLKESKATHNRDTCTPMSITVLFTITELWNQPRCSQVDEWIKTIWSIYTVEYYSAIKKLK
jgi:hypothetical protein